MLGTEYTAWRKGGPPEARKGFGAQALAVRYHPAAASVTGGARGLSAILPVPGACAVSGGFVLGRLQ